MDGVQLRDEMKDALAKALISGCAVIVGTAGADGTPDLAHKGSVMVWDEDHIAFWERAHGTTLSNMQANPKVTLLYWNPAERKLWKFFGSAELHASGALRDAVMARTIQLELDRDPDRKGVAAVVRVDKVVELGKVTMERT
jgi:predicted pyridoxine 5'-phosphate oxidase superfamily flavin-nucleotide-binding protein